MVLKRCFPVIQLSSGCGRRVSNSIGIVTILFSSQFVTEISDLKLAINKLDSILLS